MNLRCNANYVSFADIKGLRGLISHEDARRRNLLVSIDTYQELLDFTSKNPTVFVSHQWLGSAVPDPQNVHYSAIVDSCDALCRKYNISPSKLYVWIDYISIPQANVNQKQMAIDSLAGYASVCRYFVCAVPSTMHVDKNVPANEVTYAKRGWCRLEQWARLTVGGLDQMYVYEGNEARQLVPLKDTDWYADAIFVFEGDFTMEQDKYAICDVVLSMWAMMLDLNDSDSRLHLHEMVTKHKARVFPDQFFQQVGGIKEFERIYRSDAELSAFVHDCVQTIRSRGQGGLAKLTLPGDRALNGKAAGLNGSGAGLNGNAAGGSHSLAPPAPPAHAGGPHGFAAPAFNGLYMGQGAYHLQGNLAWGGANGFHMA